MKLSWKLYLTEYLKLLAQSGCRCRCASSCAVLSRPDWIYSLGWDLFEKQDPDGGIGSGCDWLCRFGLVSCQTQKAAEIRGKRSLRYDLIKGIHFQGSWCLFFVCSHSFVRRNTVLLSSRTAVMFGRNINRFSVSDMAQTKGRQQEKTEPGTAAAAFCRKINSSNSWSRSNTTPVWKK